MAKNEAQIEAMRKKSLGELGELISIKALVDASFEKIVNLNDKNMNYPYADLYAEKEGQRYVISVKARNKFQKDKRLNAFYNIGSKAYKKATAAEDEHSARAYWMAVQFDEFTYSVYLGTLEELNFKNSIPMKQCEDGSIGECLVKDKRHFFDFDYFGNQ
jgi:hypothetical protein